VNHRQSARETSRSVGIHGPRIVKLSRPQPSTVCLPATSEKNSTGRHMASDIGAAVLEQHLCPEGAPVCQLEVREAFERLSTKEKLYLHHLSAASWLGAQVSLDQTSPESPAIFELFQRTFLAAGSLEALRRAAVGGGTVSETEYGWFLEYAATFYGNMGNYLSFGDTKFVPRLCEAKFVAIVDCVADLCSAPRPSRAVASSVGEEAGGSPRDGESGTGAWLRRAVRAVVGRVYSLAPRELSLGFGRSGYYSDDVTPEDCSLVGDFMAERGMSPYNTRLFKQSVPAEYAEPGTSALYVLRVACSKPRRHPDGDVRFRGALIRIVYGDYPRADGDKKDSANPLEGVVDHLSRARAYAANEIQAGMLEAYVRHFAHGDVEEHKAAQRLWIRDLSPAVETNIGFIESYRDPHGVRGEFEGFVACVNRETSRKFGELVDRAPEFLAKLPWPREFEKDRFTRPDFTSLEVFTFASSGVPAGINIPNYEDIRQNLGFKNVSLGNVITAGHGAAETFTFLRDEDQEIFARLKNPSFEVQVGGHELLGHGSGKIFCEQQQHESKEQAREGGGCGPLNFDRAATRHPLTGETGGCGFYRAGQTWETVFGAMAAPYEECRAECVGLLLSADRDFLGIFGFGGAREQDDITYVNWLNMVRAGVVALEYHGDGRWRQAHMQARYGILRCLLAAGQDLVRVVRGDGKRAPFVELDRDKIVSVGVPAVAALLRDLQVYKSTADVGAATNLFGRLTDVPPDWAGPLRDAVLREKKPRKLLVQAHSYVDGATGEVAMRTFAATYEGMIESMVTRMEAFQPHRFY